MTKINNKALVSAVLAACISSQAGLANSVNVHGFNPTANFNYVLSEDALIQRSWGKRQQYSLIAGAYYDFVHRPLVELDATRSYRVRDIVEDMHSLNLVVGYHLFDNLQIGANISASYVSLPGSNELGMGETRVFAKHRITKADAPIAFALIPQVTFPTARKDLFLTSGGPGGGLKVSAEHDFKEAVVAANIGFMYNPDAEYRDLNMRASLPISLSTLVPLGSRWGINAEANADVLFPLNNYSTPSNFYLGGRYRIPSDVFISFGGAIGSVNNYSSANYRFIVGVTYVPTEPETPPAPPKPAPSPTPTPSPSPRVVFTTKEVVIREEVKFEYDKAILTNSGKNLLDEVAKVMIENDRYYDTIMINGHTDENGTIAYNQKLSESRAAAVKDYLITRGVKATKLKSAGYGKSRLKATAKDIPSKTARDAVNRRVEFKVLQTSEDTKKAAAALQDALNKNMVDAQAEAHIKASEAAAGLKKKKKSKSTSTTKPSKASKSSAPVKSTSPAASATAAPAPATTPTQNLAPKTNQ